MGLSFIFFPHLSILSFLLGRIFSKIRLKHILTVLITKLITNITPRKFKPLAYKLFLPVFGLLISVFSSQIVDAQLLTVKGRVTDYYSKRPLDAVTVQSTRGTATISDSLGRYTIQATDKDSLWFSYLGKNTQKYPVDTIANLLSFEVALYVDVAWLPAVKVQNRNYRNDSIQNRQDYAKIFNFQKPGIRLSSTSPQAYVPGSVTVGLDLDELINMFRFRRTRQILAFQKRLLQQEQDKYIDHRFTKRLVTQLTGLKSPSLEPFMAFCRPPYDMLVGMNDIELGYYVEQSFVIYKRRISQKLQLSK